MKIPADEHRDYGPFGVILPADQAAPIPLPGRPMFIRAAFRTPRQPASKSRSFEHVWREGDW
jgi:hypothetical protein